MSREIENLSRVDFHICYTQGIIYQYMVDNGYDLKSFSDAYLSSRFCNREMDTFYSRFHIALPDDCVRFFMPEIQNKLMKAADDDYYAAWAEDIGFMYRLLHLETSLPSAELVKLVSFDKIAKRSYVFDHYGFEEMADEIIEQFQLPRKRYNYGLASKSREEEYLKKIQERYRVMMEIKGS